MHEIVHELYGKKQSGVIFKIEFKRAYDKLRWPFLLQTRWMKGFSPKRTTSWVQAFVSGGNVVVNINDKVRPYFQTKKESSSMGESTISDSF